MPPYIGAQQICYRQSINSIVSNGKRFFADDLTRKLTEQHQHLTAFNFVNKQYKMNGEVLLYCKDHP